MLYFAEEISLTECCDWSVGQCLQTSNEASTMLFTEGACGFRKFISNVKGTLTVQQMHC